MVESLKNLDAYVCVSKLYGFALRGYDSSVEGDITRLKKGVRASNDLTWHEAFYMALKSNGLLFIFQEFCESSGKKQLGMYDYKEKEEQYLKQAAYYENLFQDNPDKKYYQQEAEQMRDGAEAAKILEKVKHDAEDFYKKIKLNKSKLIDWKDLTSVQFYKYDGATNSFIEFDHRK